MPLDQLSRSEPPRTGYNSWSRPLSVFEPARGTRRAVREGRYSGSPPAPGAGGYRSMTIRPARSMNAAAINALDDAFIDTTTVASGRNAKGTRLPRERFDRSRLGLNRRRISRNGHVWSYPSPDDQKPAWCGRRDDPALGRPSPDDHVVAFAVSEREKRAGRRHRPDPIGS